MLQRIKNARRRVRIALVGKYVQLHDAYLSVAEALRHGGYENGVEVDIQWVDAEQVTPDTVAALLGGAGGILVPGGDVYKRQLQDSGTQNAANRRRTFDLAVFCYTIAHQTRLQPAGRKGIRRALRDPDQ